MYLAERIAFSIADTKEHVCMYCAKRLVCAMDTNSFFNKFKDEAAHSDARFKCPDDSSHDAERRYASEKGIDQFFYAYVNNRGFISVFPKNDDSISRMPNILEAIDWSAIVTTNRICNYCPKRNDACLAMSPAPGNTAACHLKSINDVVKIGNLFLKNAALPTRTYRVSIDGSGFLKIHTK